MSETGNNRQFRTTRPLVLYVFTIDDGQHQGCVKIGQTHLPDGFAGQNEPGSEALTRAAQARYPESVTLAIRLRWLYAEQGDWPVCHNSESISDKRIHEVLLRSGVERKEFTGLDGRPQEWFVTDVETAKRAIAAFKTGKHCLSPNEISVGRTPKILREEQQTAVDLATRIFGKGGTRAVLWDCKPRFGKTLSALTVVKRLNVRRTLIVTHRPDVESEWHDEFCDLFCEAGTEFVYGSRKEGETFADFKRKTKEDEEWKDKRLVYFMSMQDLRGSRKAGGKMAKNDAEFQEKWDLVVVDEGHEGTQTKLGKAVISVLGKRNPRLWQLWLSGTPFNLVNRGEFSADNTAVWNYIDEQRRKREWAASHPGETNPYEDLPTMNYRLYDLGRLLRTDYGDKVFTFDEFMRVDSSTKRFTHEDDVRRFLDLLCTTDEDCLYPFANVEFQDMFRHTLWRVPGIEAGRALSGLLQAHPVFGHFRVVNICGPGDDDDPDKDRKAKIKVRKAIGQFRHTITLTCGRLTTGSTIPQWTAVFMLYGAKTVSLASYMQTAFRAQNPATIDGKSKTDCYVFDFAPDRALQMYYDTAVNTAAAKGSSESGKVHRVIGEMTNYCPIISYDGSTTHKYDMESLYAKLNDLQLQRIVSRSFASSELYVTARLENIDDEAWAILQQLPDPARRQEKQDGTIVTNNEGFSGKRQSKSGGGGGGDGGDDGGRGGKSVAQKRQEEAQKRLDAVSSRLPLIVYALRLTDGTEVTLDDILALDDASWRAFMPAEVDKALFSKLMPYYNADRFQAAAHRLREMTAQLDTLPVEERVEQVAKIVGLMSKPAEDCVFTPWKTVCLHLGKALGPPAVYRQTGTQGMPTARILDICSKTGLYSLYSARELYRTALRSRGDEAGSLSTDEQRRIWDEILAKNIYAVCGTPLTEAITRRTLADFRDVTLNVACIPDISRRVVKPKKENEPNPVPQLTRDLKTPKTYNPNNTGPMIDFDAVVGNPPYQVEGNNNSRKLPLYHHFYDVAMAVAPRVTLITPSRFLFNAGMTPKAWNHKMLHDPHFRVVYHAVKPADLFDEVDIKGGVAIGLHDETQTFGAIGTYTHYDELNAMLAHVCDKEGDDYENMTEITSPQGIYRFTDKFFEDFPKAEEYQGKGTGTKITSSVFESLTNAFLPEPPADKERYYEFMGRAGGERVRRWVRREYIISNDFLTSWNVLVPEANGTGAIGEVLSTPVIGQPVIGHTDTFISVGQFQTGAEAEACMKYVKSKFARTMLGILKATQHTPRDCWRYVPLQDFTPQSDIDWSQPVSDIDRQLYRKYGLSEKETAFVEKMIRPME